MEAQVIHFITPFSVEKNIGKEYNERISELPDDCWICVRDGDTLFLTPDWGRQVHDIIKNHGEKYGLIGCVTNKLARPIQLIDGKFNDDLNIKNHYKIAERLKNEKWAEVEDVTHKRYIAGMFMLFPKEVWKQVKFKENTPAFDDILSKSVVKAGYKLGLATGLYIYHLYRIWSERPIGDRKHLFK